MTSKQTSPEPSPVTPIASYSYLPYLKAWRVRSGLTLAKLSERTQETGKQIPLDTLSRLENVKRRAYAATVRRLAKALRISPHVLLTVDPEKDLPQEGEAERRDVA